MNRAFIYGDLLFETIRVENKTPQLALLHYERLIQSSHLLKFETALSYDQFIDAINECVNAHELINARVRFVLHRNADGFYTPHDNTTAFFVEAFPLNISETKPLRVGIYTDNYKPCNELASIKSGSAQLYVMASIFAKENGFDDAIILNEHGCICEATSSNVFIVKDNITYTPAITEGCVGGVMRKHVMQKLLHEGYEVKEAVVTMKQLLEADNVFFTNAIQGIRQVSAIGDRQYAKQIT